MNSLFNFLNLLPFNIFFYLKTRVVRSLYEAGRVITKSLNLPLQRLNDLNKMRLWFRVYKAPLKTVNLLVILVLIINITRCPVVLELGDYFEKRFHAKHGF